MRLLVIMFRPFIKVRVWKHFPTYPFAKACLIFAKVSYHYLIREMP